MDDSGAGAREARLDLGRRVGARSLGHDSIDVTYKDEFNAHDCCLATWRLTRREHYETHVEAARLHGATVPI